MNISRYEALKAVDDIFNYCEEIDYSLPENERSGYKMLPDIHKIRKYIVENTRPHGEWIYHKYDRDFECSICNTRYDAFDLPVKTWDYCPNCGARMTGEGESE